MAHVWRQVRAHKRDAVYDTARFFQGFLYGESMRLHNKQRLYTIGELLAEGKTFQEIGEVLAISAQRVHQIWNARKTAAKNYVRPCTHCGEPLDADHGNTRLHPGCRKPHRLNQQSQYARRHREKHLVTLAASGGKLTVGTVESRLRAGWTWEQATTIPKGKHRSKYE